VIGTILQDRYELLSELGRGGMALVWRARDRRLGREVAIKLISTEGLDENAIERFQREALLIAALDHPSIVPIYDYGRHEIWPSRWLFFVMPVLPGKTLYKLMRERSLQLPEFLEIFVRVAEALAYSASQKIIHRDIKPENIMVCRRGDAGSSVDQAGGDRAGGESGGGDPAAIDRLWVMDFGLATAQESTRLTRTGNLPGTLSYLSPEQVLSLEVDGRSDLYSLGVIAYEYLSGRRPYVGTPAALLYRIVHETLPPLEDSLADPRFLAIVAKCLAKDPAARFANGLELAAATRPLLQQRGAPRAASAPSGDAAPPSHAGSEKDKGQEAAVEVLLFGRERELAELDLRLDSALRGEGQLMVLGGDPGSGKTRLLREVERRASKRGIVTLHGRFADPQAGFPYQALGEVLLEACSRQLFPPHFDWSPVATGLVDLFPALAEVPEIAAAASPRHVSAAGDLAHVYELIGRCLGGLAGGRPLLILLEELHADSTSLPLLLYLFRRFGASPNLIVSTYRRTEVGRRHPLTRLIRSLEGEERFLHLEIGNLSEEEHRQMLAALLGNDPGASLAGRIFESTDGNPLFTAELVRSLGRSGELQRDDTGQVRFKGDEERLGEMPVTLQQALEVRLERLPELAGELLQLAAVLGRSFSLRDLEALAEDEGLPEIDDTLDLLLSEALFEEDKAGKAERGVSAVDRRSSRSSAAGQLRFSTGLLCHLVGERLSRRRRRRLNQRAALILERRHGENLARFFPRLVHHWAAADVGARVVPYGLLHVRQLLALSCFDDVLRIVRLTLEFLEDDDAGGQPDAQALGRAPLLVAALDLSGAEGELRLAAATALRATGQVDQALREAEKALRSNDHEALPEAAARSALFLAETCFLHRRIEPCQSWVEAGLRRAQGDRKSPALRLLLELQATIANLRGDYTQASESLAELESLQAVEKPRPAPPLIGGELRVGLVNGFSVADPAQALSLGDAEVLGNVFEPLLAVDQEGRLSPRLCKAFEASPDGRIFVFFFDPARIFSDGRPADAANVKLALEGSAKRARPRCPAIFGLMVGADEFLAGDAAEIRGLRVASRLVLEIELVQEMAFFPSLLTDLRSALALPGEQGLVGSGPFRVESWSASEVGLRRSEKAMAPALLERVHYQVMASSDKAIEAFEAGQVDVALEIRGSDLDDRQRDPQLRALVDEVDQHAVCYLLLSPQGPRTRDPRLRRVLAGVVDVRQLLWRTVARYVAPAFGLLPPEVLGHDGGREGRQITRLEAIEALEEQRPLPIKLRAVTFHRFADQFRSLIAALLAEWSLLGIEVDLEELSPEGFFSAVNDPRTLDLVFVRWAPDHLDADAYVYEAFHSRAGAFGRLIESPELDELAQRARSERHVAARDVLYRRVDETLLSQDWILPFCRELSLRLVAPSVVGLGRNFACGALALGGTFIDRKRQPSSRFSLPKGSLEVPLMGTFNHLDPSATYMVDTAEVVSNIFETLTTIGSSGAPVPRLAEEMWALDGGRRFRFRLRDVRFHDGRKLTTRDVHYSLLRAIRSAPVDFATLDLPILGSARVRARESDELAGFHAISDRELEFVLEKPLPFFPALLSHPLTAIVPEGSRRFDVSWRDGCAGTGPFRVVSCEGGRRIELAAHPGYWQPGKPRLARLVFHLASDSARLAENLRGGVFSLASGFAPGELSAFARDSSFAGGLVSQPALNSHFAVLDPRRGPLADLEKRRLVAQVLRKARRDLIPILGPAGVVAETFLPPSLLGVDSVRQDESFSRLRGRPLAGMELVVAQHSRVLGTYAVVWSVIARALERAGAKLQLSFPGTGELLQALSSGGADLIFPFWSSPYPDPDGFATVFEPKRGLLGKAVADPRIDALRSRARSEAEPAERRQLYLELEEALATGAFLVPIFHEQASWLARPEVQGLRLRFGWPRVAWEELSLV